MPPERCGSLAFHFEEKDWWNWLDPLNEMFAEQESVDGLGWTSTNPSFDIWLICIIER
jgi:hypothetical protein